MTLMEEPGVEQDLQVINGPEKQYLHWVHSFWYLLSNEFEFPDISQKYLVGHLLIKSEQLLPTWILLWSFLLVFQT